MKLLKILILTDEGIVVSPVRRFIYGKLEDVIGNRFVCDNFDSDFTVDCSSGFYATTIGGLIYTNLSRKNTIIMECEMEGKEAYYSQYKRRFEAQTFLRVVPMEEVKVLAKEYSDSIDWNYYGALFPINPLDIHNDDITDDDIENLRKWASVRASVGDSVLASVWASVRDLVGDSVGDSVWDLVLASVWDSVGDSVWDLVGDSVRDLVRAYISSLFPNIKKWKYIDHEEGINPFQCGVDLWNRGFIPTKIINKWFLWSAKTKSIVYTLED